MTNEEKIKQLKQRLAKLVELMNFHGPPAISDKDERKEWRQAIYAAEHELTS